MNSTHKPYDVVILGGGLSGLTLSLQLKKRMPGLSILVLERRIHPVPEAAFKVGESTVEIGAHYFDKILDLGEHLRQNHLRKFGFRFFFSEGRRDIDQVTEIGASRHLSVPSYQIDRGIFENFLGTEAQRRGIHFLDASMVRQIDLVQGSKEKTARHLVAYEREGQRHEVQARWVIDACGRAGLIKRKLDLAESNEHDTHAVWFRIKDRIVLDEWSDNMSWRAQCTPQTRWLSTNHLVGTGYWVWLIPLSSGSHSVGIVANPAQHPLDRMDTFDKAMDWLQEFQPLLFDELDGKRDLLQDFAFFKRFSYGCKQVFSEDRWALTGEAGLFLDPFYSPGSDFIAISNTYITELVELDMRGERIGAKAQIFDQTVHSFYDSTLALYTKQYPLFGDPEVLPVKVIWDYTYYWGILAQFFFQERLTDLSSMSTLRNELTLCQQLNLAIQDFLRAWSSVSTKHNPAVMLDQARMPWFAALNKSLNDSLDTAQFIERIRFSCAQLQTLAREIVRTAIQAHPTLDGARLEQLLSQTHEEPSHDRTMLPRTAQFAA